MKLNLGMDLDEVSAKKMLGLHPTRNGNTNSQYDLYNPSFLSGEKNGQRIGTQQLKHNTPQDLDERDFELTALESKLHKLFNLEHNTADIVNENLKLKELLRYLRSNYTQDMIDSKSKLEDKSRELSEKIQVIKQLEESLSISNKEIETLKRELKKKDQDLEDLFKLLAEREKEIKASNKYAQSILDEKSKLLEIMDQKDRKIEELEKNFFHSQKQFEEDQIKRQDLVNLL